MESVFIRILFFLTLPAALVLIWFVNFCDVIPEVYPLQRNWAWAGWSITLFGLLLLIGLRLAKKIKIRIWPGVLFLIVVFLCMSFRLYIKQDGRWFSALSIYDEKEYRYSWHSRSNDILLYDYYAPGFLFTPSESIWKRDGSSIFMHKIWGATMSRVDSIVEKNNEVIIYALLIENDKMEVITINKQTNAIQKKQTEIPGVILRGTPKN